METSCDKKGSELRIRYGAAVAKALRESPITRALALDVEDATARLSEALWQRWGGQRELAEARRTGGPAVRARAEAQLRELWRSEAALRKELQRALVIVDAHLRMLFPLDVAQRRGFSPPPTPRRRPAK